MSYLSFSVPLVCFISLTRLSQIESKEALQDVGQVNAPQNDI